MSNIAGLPPLDKLPIRQFIEHLNSRHGLGLTPAEMDRSASVLQEQWFNVAEELRSVDMEAFGFLPLPKLLPNCIFAFFSPNYNPNQQFTPASQAAASSASSLQLPHSHSADLESAHGVPSNTNGTSPHSAQPFLSSAMSSLSVSPSPASLNEEKQSESRIPAVPASASSSSAAAYGGLDLAALGLEGGGISEGAIVYQGSRENSRSDEGGDDESSSDGDSGSGDDSGSGSGDENASPVDASGAAPKKKKKKWDRHSSLLALKKAVDHVCASATKEEHVLASLMNILRAAMQKSGKHTQNTLRELMKKLQDKQNEQGGAHGAAAGIDALPPSDAALPVKSMSVGSNDLKSNGLAPPQPQLGSSVSYSSPSASSSSSVSFGFTCGVCHGAKDKSVTLECGHKFCGSCISEYVNNLVGQKQAVGIKCPYTAASGSLASCQGELSTATIQNLLSPADFESYLNATLMSFIESDDCLTVTCPNVKCGSIMSVEPLKNHNVPDPITEKDEDGRTLTKETYLHFIEYRVRCRDCSTNFCAKCRAQPYHKGHTCAQFKEYQASRHCRFCTSKLTAEEALKLSNGVRDVCSEKECQDKSLYSCEKILACGCPCRGIKNEATCLGCLTHDKSLKIDEDEFCGICYVEGLKEAPCIQNECGHIFHYTCLKQKLEAKWPGARVGFEFKGCPLCKKDIKHPALTDILAPINAIESVIKDKALQRLKYEGRDKDPAIVNENGAYHNDPIGFAMKQYLFFMCYTCKKPYFAGGYQCQEANQAFDPAELICPSCQPSSVEDCSVHGRDWLAYKCRYCCSFANWTCWGNTHFCDKCHKSGVWQGLAVFRTGKNKKKLWEYEQCPTLAKQVEAIGRENGTEEEKNAKIGKLLCAPRSCPLGVRHPPNGLEFGLGCSMCEDKQSIGDAAALVESIRAKLTAVKAELGKAPRVFIPTSDFDMEGVFWYLGTCGKTQPWSNPAEAGFVKLGSSGIMNDSAPLSTLVGRDLVRLVSQPQRQSWFSWELIDLQLCLTHYTLKHYNSWDTECIRQWNIEGSNDGSQWEIIASHINDTALNKKGATYTWAVNSHGRKYRQFRILQTGRNSNNNFYLALSGSEFYGELSLAPILPSPAIALATSRQVFTPRSDFDTNGLMYYLGTQGGKAPWKNPCELGQVVVAFSEMAAGPPPSEPPSAVVGRETVRCVSAAKPNQWVVIDITPSGKRIKPSHYSLRHYNSWDLEALRNWRFEGSSNGIDWYVLSVHLNDSSLDRKGATHTWALPGCQVICSMFRIWQTGVNSNNHHYLACSGFEVYGTLEEALPPPPPPRPQQPIYPFQPIMQQPMQPMMLPQQHQPIQPAAGIWAPQQPQMMMPPQQPMIPQQPYGGYPGMQPQPQQPQMLQQQPQYSAGAVQTWTQPTPLLPPGPPDSSESGLVLLKYSRDMDQNGLMYYLGSIGRRSAWQNPQDLGFLQVICSELATQPPSMPAKTICGQEAVRCCTVGKPDMYYMVDLRDKKVALTNYTIRHYTSWDTEALRNWKLEGSNDGLHWDVLRVHRNDDTLKLKGQTATWPIIGAYDRFYRLIRIQMTGPNSNNNHYLALSCLELYGILELWPQKDTPTVKVAQLQQAAHARGFKTDSVDEVRAYQQALKAGVANGASLVPAPFHAQPSPQLSAAAPQQQPPLQQLASQPSAQPSAANSAVFPLAPASASAVSSASSVSASAVIPAHKYGPPAYRPFEDGMEFVYQADLDANGILYWLGTQRWTKPWQNPAELGVVQVTSVPLAIQPKSEPASAIVGRSLCRCVTLPNRESWFVIDLLSVWVRPTAYTLRHYDSWDTEALRDWKLQGSNDGKKWTKLLSHKKDEALDKKGATHTWPIPKPKKAYRMFRILQTGKNSNNHWYCALSSFEIYGKVYSYKKS